ncbi:Rne/Rng family ribonuclease, partial [Actinotignum schaalii]
DSSARAPRGSQNDDAAPEESDHAETDETSVAPIRRRRRSLSSDDEVAAPKGSTRLAAKRARRRENREGSARRRGSITEVEYLARRESVKRDMIVRERDGLNQIAVLEDDVLVEHYVARHTQISMVGNVYLGRVQNVLPSMEAAFVDIGK